MPRIAKGFTQSSTNCDPHGYFVHDNRVPYRSVFKDGHKYETWRECCPNCGAWVVVERIDGEIQ